MTKWHVDKSQIRRLCTTKMKKASVGEPLMPGCFRKVQDLWFHFPLKWSMEITSCGMHEFEQWMEKEKVSGAASLILRLHSLPWLAQLQNVPGASTAAHQCAASHIVCATSSHFNFNLYQLAKLDFIRVSTVKRMIHLIYRIISAHKWTAVSVCVFKGAEMKGNWPPNAF